MTMYDLRMADHVPLVSANRLHQGPRCPLYLLAHPGAGLRGARSANAKVLDGLARNDKPPDRRLKAGTLLVREYRGERHTVTVVAGGYVWREGTYASLLETLSAPV
jgi:hypothetical protein